jgi:hypothetical protein
MSIAIPQSVVNARINELSAVGEAYGARIKYAEALVDASEGVLWYTDGVAMPALIEAEKKEYYKGLKEIGYSNPSNAWKMVKKYATDYAQSIGLLAKPEAENGEAENGEAESSGDARHTRSFSLRVIEDVTAIYKAGRKLEKEGALSDKEKECNVHLASALQALGLDLAAL